jgi:hypothetical protein
MQMALFWDVALCSLVEVCRHFRSACCLHHQGDNEKLIVPLMMEAASSTERMENFYQTTQCNIPEDSYRHTYHHENLRSHCGFNSFPWCL